MVENVSNGEIVNVAADNVVLALGIRPKTEIVDKLEKAFPEIPVMVVGDARKGGRIGNAVRDGFEAGYTFMNY